MGRIEVYIAGYVELVVQFCDGDVGRRGLVWTQRLKQVAIVSEYSECFIEAIERSSQSKGLLYVRTL
jgi:hypothetical protein